MYASRSAAPQPGHCPCYFTDNAATFSLTAFTNSSSNSGSTFLGVRRGHWSHLGCEHFEQGVPFGVSAGNLVPHAWQEKCGIEFGPKASPGYPYGYLSFLALQNVAR